MWEAQYHPPHIRFEEAILKVLEAGEQQRESLECHWQDDGILVRVAQAVEVQNSASERSQ